MFVLYILPLHLPKPCQTEKTDTLAEDFSFLLQLFFVLFIFLFLYFLLPLQN